MEFAVPNALGLLLEPSTILVGLASVGVLLLWAGLRRVATAFLSVGVGGLLAVLVLPVQHWALLPLEDRFPRNLPPPHVDGIVVLGGALKAFVTAERGIPSLNEAAERMTELVALARRYPQAKLVFTGGDASILPGGMREADIARQLFTDLGVPSERVIYESEARNTYENAILVSRLVKPLPGETWLLVTSASHMPRAMGAFRRVGWSPMAWPVAYKAVQQPLVAIFTPPGEKLAELDWALHEWEGLLAYRLAGRTAALFPGPDF